MNSKIVYIKVKNKKTGSTQDFRLDKKRVVLGSASSNDVRLDGDDVSPVHAILEVSGIDGKPVIYDLASETGVKVSGKTSFQSSISASDTVEIGSFSLNIDIQPFNEIPKAPPERIKESFGQKLFVSEKEDLKPLLLENESEVIDIFDHRPESKQSLQVVMFYGNTILDVEHFVNPKRVVIGPGKKEDFAIPPFIPAFELVSTQGSQYTLHVHEKMKGMVQKSGKMIPIAELPTKAVPFEDKDFAKVQIGDVSFFLSFIAAPPKLKRRKLFEKDPLFFRVWLSSLILTGLILFTIMRVTVNPTIEIEQLPERVATIIYEPKNLPVEKPPVQIQEAEVKPTPAPEQKKTIKITPKTTVDTEQPKNAVIGEKKPEAKQAKQNQEAKAKSKPKAVAQQASGQEGAGERARGDEGKRGAPNKPKAAVPQNKALRPGEGKPKAVATSSSGKSQTNDLGVVDMFKSDKGTLSKLLAGGKGATNAANKLEGYSGFTTEGKGGLGEAGSGAGGGGKSLGLGGLSDKGHGGGKHGVGLGALGSGGNMLGGKGKVSVTSGGGAGEPLVMGAIDTDAIAREINKHRDEIKYCYEKEINAENPSLAGRVGIRFVIGTSGVVSAAAVSSTTLKNANTESCVVDVIRRIHFPPVKGGDAEVTYPFVFKPTND